MKIWAISDLHLSFACDKPMDVFGGNWENYIDKIKENWQNMVGPNDLVLVAGDISWAMKIDEAVALNFNAPHSFTGENVVEISCHGGIYAVKEVLSVIFNFCKFYY